jgi:hypothetical protein
MADGYATDLQQGLRAALAADAGVTALVGARIYDKPPHSPTYPFIRFGDFDVDHNDTNCTLSAFVTVSVEAHSRSISGSIEVQRIVEAVRAVLHRSESSVTLANYALIELIEQTSLVTRDTDGEAFTGVTVYRAFLDA